MSYVSGWADAFGTYTDSLQLSSHFHAKQRAVNEDDSGFVAVIGGRRSGKTEGFVSIGLETADMHPGATVPYAGPFLRVVEDIVYPKVQELSDRYDLKFEINRGEGKIFTPNGGCLQMFGLSTKPDAEKGRGKKFPMVIIDEAGACNQDTLQRCVEDTFGPATADFHGAGGRGMLIGGNPGYAAGAYWEKVCGGNTHKSQVGASVHHMTIRDNPFFAGRAEKVMRNWLAKNALTRSSVKFRREWLGEFCVDLTALCYSRWNGKVYPHTSVPLGGRTSMGLDLGVKHPNAWVVVRYVPEYYLAPFRKDVLRRRVVAHFVESLSLPDLSLDEIADITREMALRWNVGAIRGDGAGGGLQTIKELSEKYGLPVSNVKRGMKSSKAARIWSLDSMLGKGTAIIHEGCEYLPEQLRTVPWDDKRADHDPLHADHELDAAHYALAEDISLIEQDLMLPPEPGSPEWTNMQHQKEKAEFLAKIRGEQQ